MCLQEIMWAVQKVKELELQDLSFSILVKQNLEMKWA